MIRGDLSKTFTTTRGPRQEDGLSCLLFKVALEKVISDSVERNGTIPNTSTTVLPYADDVDIIA